MQAIARALCLLIFPLSVFAAGLDSISNTQATGGLRQALEQGAKAAVSQLGQDGGFLNNPKVRIPLPGMLEKAKPLMKMLGQGDEIDALETAMNRAAEAAVPEARDLLVAAVKKMSVQDAKDILTGGDNSVTRYFEDNTRAALTTRFLPVVEKQTSRLSLAEQYNALAGKAGGTGLLGDDEKSVESYVTARALDGLYKIIGEQEKAIRSNPMQAAGSLAKKVFGALR